MKSELPVLSGLKGLSKSKTTVVHARALVNMNSTLEAIFFCFCGTDSGACADESYHHEFDVLHDSQGNHSVLYPCIGCRLQSSTSNISVEFGGIVP